MSRSATRAMAGLLLGAAIAASGCTSARRVTMLRTHPEATQRAQQLPRVVIVPPQLLVEEERLTEASARLRDMEDQLRPKVVDRVSSLLSQRGFTPVSAHLDEGDLGNDQALRSALTTLRGESAHLSRRLYWKGPVPLADASQVQMTIGPIVNRFADRAGADAIVLLRGAVIIKSAGMRRKDTFFELFAPLTRPQPVAAGWIDLQLVDGTSGDLLWANRGGAVFYKELDIDFLVNQVLNGFDLRLPIPASSAAAEVAQPAASTSVTDRSPPSHDDAAGNKGGASATRAP